MNPADKRLAIAVTDHTLEYGVFEGIIPKGRYGAGPVVIWDHGTYESLEGDDPMSQLTRGSLKFELHGKQLRGAFALVKLRGPRTIPRLRSGSSRLAPRCPMAGRSAPRRASEARRGTSGKEWLLMKKADAYANTRFTITSALTPAKRQHLKETIPPCEAS